MSIRENFCLEYALTYSNLLMFRFISAFLLREVFLRALEHSNAEPGKRPHVGWFLMGWIYSCGQPEEADVQLQDELMTKSNSERNDKKLKQ